MKLFKISTLALAMALSGWVACSSDNGGSKNDAQQIPGTGGNTAPDGPMGTGGSGGSLDAAVLDSAVADVPIPSDVPIGLDSGPGIDTTLPVDGGTNLCTGLTADQCHASIINYATDPSVSALDPGPNPAVPYPTCAAQ